MHNVTVLLTLGGLHKVGQLLKAHAGRERNGSYCKAPSGRELSSERETEGERV